VLDAVAVCCIVAVMVLYAVFTAQRLDRLHARVDAAGAALDAQLRRRGVVAQAFAQAEWLPDTVVHQVVLAARDANAVIGLGHNREVAENALSRALVRAATASSAVTLSPSQGAVELHDEALRATFARRFYNDTVRDALTIRDRRVVRWLRLAGRAPHPAYFEMDDGELPLSRISVASQHYS
jgi:hypothetical protein